MNKRNIFKVVLGILGILFTIYGLMVLFTIGPRSFFNFFYLCGGIFFLGLYRHLDYIQKKINRKVLKALNVFVLVFLLSFTITEAKIIQKANGIPKDNADYVIVLGCLVNKKGPSLDYRHRLNAAMDYLKDNPDTIIITTGGQGKNEPFTEAESGKEYLIDKGISEDQILVENKSTNTFENLQNVKNILKNQDISKLNIVIISADYHLYRAELLAKKLGYENLSFTASHGLFYLVPHQYTREYFALIKAYLFDRV